MRGLILFSVISLQFCWTYGAGLGSYSYQDASGNRYGGIYGINDGEAYNFAESNNIPFGHVPAPFADFQDLDSFFPEYFRNLQNLIQEHVGVVHSVQHPGGGVSHHMSGTHYGPDGQPSRVHSTVHSSSNGLGMATGTQVQSSMQSSSSGLGQVMPVGIQFQPQHQGHHQTQQQSQHQSMLPGMNMPGMMPRLSRPVMVPPQPMYPMVYAPQAFAKSSDDQRKALVAARKAFDLTSNQAGFTPDFNFDRFPSFPMFGPQMPQMQQFPMPQYQMPQYQMPQFPLRSQPPLPTTNAAFAAAAAGPGFQEQQINLYPPNSQKPNIQMTKLSDKPLGKQNFYSVQSSSFATSSNINGQESIHKGGETVVNDNGKITKYSLND